jgi:archaellum component FlaC
MNRIQKLERLRDLADELNRLQQELASGMNVLDSQVHERHTILEEIWEDAEEMLKSLSFWSTEDK